jgi:uncharacterized protein (DUF305 family)
LSTLSPDIRFLRGMIPHHEQALAMTKLVPSRTTREDIRRIAERITRAQTDEIAAMRRQLRKRDATMPTADPHGHHGSADAHALMSGMLTDEEMRLLETASGASFDRLFLEKMIRHHEGALVMVRELFNSPGAAQSSELYQIAADVDADQRSEINRMQTLLRALQ